MYNYKLTIQYDGTDYAGWQIQDNAKTIQQVLTDGAKQILQQEVSLIGSGRTDSGVHALGQVANFKCERELDLYKFTYPLNSILPYDISVNKIESVDENFHSRFDAKSRSYIYLITKQKSPFFFRYSYFYHSEINIDMLNNISKIFFGEKDFTSFSKVNTEVQNKVCIVKEARWRKSGDLYIFYVEANRYLYGMVRAVVGTLLKALNEHDPEKYIEEVFIQKNRESAADAAPAKGLFLYKVKY
jgi:tRNA pseudouridine38-40 synthase